MEPQEQELSSLPISTYAGILSPSVPLAIADHMAQWGPAPVVFGGIALGILTWKGPAIAEFLARRESLLLALANHPEALAWFDARTRGVFSDHLERLRRRKPRLFHDAAPRPHELTEAQLAQDGMMQSYEQAGPNDPTVPLPEPGPMPGQAPDALIGPEPSRRLLLAANFQPDANAPLATGVAAFGIPGSGKTTAVIRFFEQYVKRFRVPFVAFDSQGDWKSLVESGFCPRGLVATPGNVPDMREVIETGLQVVFDLGEWREPGCIEMSYELCAELIAEQIRALMAVQKMIQPHKRFPCLVGLDEAQLWIPEGRSGLMSQEAQQTIKSVVTALATTGRKLGVVPFIAGPRIAQIDKDAIAGIETRLFGKADLDNDLKRYREYLPVREFSDQQIRELGQGELLVSMGGKRLLVQFFNRETVHVSHTPRVSQSLARFAGAGQRIAAQQAEPLITRQAVTPRRRVPSSYDAYARRRSARREAMSEAVASAVHARHQAQAEPEQQRGACNLDRALQAWDAGHTTIDALAVALGISSWNARPIYHQVKQIRQS